MQYNYLYNGLTLDNVVYYGHNEWTAHYEYCGSNIGGGLPWLLRACDDPMVSGPMKRIAYEYKPATPNNPDGSAPVYGQILSERYWDGVPQSAGVAVSTLTVGEPNLNNRRMETRGDGATRKFIYNGSGYLTWASDFTNHWASQDYDSNKYINAVMDRKGHTTDYVRDAITGNVLEIKYPATPNDTQPQQTEETRSRVTYTYTNNYYLHTIQGENGQTTTVDRDGINRITAVHYPDGAQETFPLYNPFNQVLTHGMITGGTETFTYDGRGLKQTYRNPDNAGGNPTASYSYDDKDRVNGIFDALNNPTNFQYNDRGQLTMTTLPPDPSDNTRHTITNAYNTNGDGTLISVTDQLTHVTSYTYDDYRRLRSITTPPRGPAANTTRFYYDGSGTGDDYRYMDANVTWTVLPSGKKIKTEYEANRRMQMAEVGYGTSDGAITSYDYDNVGNVTTVTAPSGHWFTTTYDERNRPSSTSDRGRVTSLTYDLSGRRNTIGRPNGQLITYEEYDQMNRLKRQRVSQIPGPDAVTTYTYYAPGEGQPVGFLKEFVDPHLYAVPPVDKYSYHYDVMGRKTQVQYPLDSNNVRRTEQWSYDTAGRLYQFTNRNGNIQTFGYDALNRMTGFTWNDGGTTPSVSFGYDAASRLSSINNANANISRAYYDDNLLRSETENILNGGNSKTVTYTYDADGNRGSTTYPAPENFAFNYAYNGRNQLQAVNGWATYTYDGGGHVGLLTQRTLASGPYTTYNYDAFDRVTWISNYFNGSSPGFNYGYDDANNTDNRKFTRRLPQDVGDVFKYDLAAQAIGVQLNVPTPQNVQSIPQTISYDANGNRTDFHPYGTTETYAINNLSQYISRTIGNVTSNAVHDNNGNPIVSLDGGSYSYDAQNRLVTASKNGVTMSLAYDGLNRQVRRTVTGGLSIGGGTTFNVWDGWDLIEEYQEANGGAATASYLYGATGLICAGTANGPFSYYFQDANGSTSHVTDENGFLKEWYRYDLQGTPFIYDADNNQLSTSNRSVRHLFTGQQWYQDLGLYDLRNRFYSPDIGRFLQPDPIGFAGYDTNLYRYCYNNPTRFSDPTGELAYYSYDMRSRTVQVVIPVQYQGPGLWIWSGFSDMMKEIAKGNPYVNVDVRGPWPGESYNTIYVDDAVSDTNGGWRPLPESIDNNAVLLRYNPKEPANTFRKDAIGIGNYFASAKIWGTWASTVLSDLAFSSNTNGFRSPGGDTGSYIDESGRVIVWASEIMPGDPVNGTGRIRDGSWGGFYTRTMSTTLANPYGSWGPSFGRQLTYSIFGADNWYSGLDPNAAFGHIYEGNPIGAMEPGVGPYVPVRFR